MNCPQHPIDKTSRKFGDRFSLYNLIKYMTWKLQNGCVDSKICFYHYTNIIPISLQKYSAEAAKINVIYI